MVDDRCTSHFCKRTSVTIAEASADASSYTAEINRHFQWLGDPSTRMSSIYNGNSKSQDLYVSRCVNSCVLEFVAEMDIVDHGDSIGDALMKILTWKSRV
jgi:hypothetical protein